MRRLFLPLLVLVLGTLLATTGCRKLAPVQDLSGQPFPAVSAKFTDTKVKDAIVRAGADLGWQVIPSGPQEMTATLHIRAHVAVVAITYSLKDKSYAIRYVRSTNLKYKDGMIHPQYNNWVNNLDNAIASELAKLQ